MKTLIWATLCITLMVGIIGCTCPGAQPQPVVRKPAPKPAPVAAPAPAPKTGTCGDYTVSVDYMKSGAIRLQKTMPAMIQLNAPFEYTITLTNLTNMTLTDVAVTERVPASLKELSSSPAGKKENGIVTWKMDSLGPKATDKITVRGTATEAGCLQTCADVTYVILACAKTQVVQPALTLSKSAPQKVTICDAIPMKFVVSNKGTGTATNVKISDALPEGLMTQDGKKSIEIAVGNLAAGQSATRTVVTKAAKKGTFKNQASAMADGNLKAQSEVTTTVVTQPVLAITKSGPKKEYLGRSIKYDITVTNKGNTAAVDTVITDTIPAGVSGTQATAGGVVSGSQITWKVGSLAPNASKTVSVSYKPSRGGNYANTAKATAVCADAVSASAQTQIDAIAAILLEVVDLSDPIEVGGNETYLITVTNQGSAPDTNIIIKTMLEDSMQFVSATGATNGTLSGSTVTFAPLPSLAPKAKVSWRVTVKAVKAGDVRFTVTMDSDQLTRNVQETEATNFYE
ncbi:MAG: DUF11 domain-containing protein [Planctomycetes bacterium]|nr:DUF11 domain-containing protein [Planctomycetota bacterium]